MKLKTLKDVNLKEKVVLYRAPYDISVEEKNGILELSDDMRIKATIPTLKYLLKENCKIVILTYVGRPDGVIVENLRTKTHAKKLSILLSHPVLTIDDCIGEKVQEQIRKMKKGEILMLENVRFYKEEMLNDDSFAKELCKGKDLIVFDGFPQAHRVHASTVGIMRNLEAVVGFYFEKEINMLSNLLENPKHPFTVIIGGAKISDKVDIILNLLNIADNILIGGATANVFLKAQGRILGDSFVEDVFVDSGKREKRDWVKDAEEILKKAKNLDKKIITPIDLVISSGISTKVITTEEIPAGFMALDIGPETQKIFSKIISESQTVFLAGPMGKFEDSKFAEGSKIIINTIKDVKLNLNSETIIAGGDTIDLVRTYGNLEDYSHISLAGGATLEFLAGKELPVLKMLIH